MAGMLTLWLAAAPAAHADAWAALTTATDAGMEASVTCADARAGWLALSALSAHGDTGASALADALFPENARLTFGLSLSGGSLLRYSTDATAATVAARFAALSGDRSALAGPGDTWIVQNNEGHAWDVTSADGWAQISDGPAGRIPKAPPPEEIRAALPDNGAGCMVYADLAPGGAPPIQVGAHLSLDPDAPVPFALLSPPLSGVGGMRFAASPPITLRARHRPDALLHVGLGADDIDFRRYAEGARLLSLQRAQRHLPIARGSVLASVNTERGPATVIVVPLARPLSAATTARRATDVLASAGARIAHVDRTHFVMAFGDLTFHGVGQRGRLYLSTDLPLLYEITAESGEPWLTPGLEAASRRFPLVLELNGVLESAPSDAPPIQVAFDVRSGMATGEISLPMSLGALKALLPSLGSDRRQPPTQPAQDDDDQRM